MPHFVQEIFQVLSFLLKFSFVEYFSHKSTKKRCFKIQARCFDKNFKVLPWIAAACSLVMKSAGLGGGVFDTFGDLGSENVAILPSNNEHQRTQIFFNNSSTHIDR